MYQDVMLIDQPNNEPEFKIITARPRGRVVVRCDGNEVESFTVLFEGENGTYYTQEIVCFSNPFRVLFYSSEFQSFEDAFLTLSAFNNSLSRSDF